MTADRERSGARQASCRATGLSAFLATALISSLLGSVALGAPPAVEAQAAPIRPPEDNPKAPSATPADREPGAGSPGGAGGGAKEGRKVLGRIRGSVYDPKRQPLSGLMVQLISKGEGGLLRVTGTDEKGQYIFQDLPAGDYDVEVGADGYRRQRKGRIVVQPPFRNIVDFEIEPLRPGEAGEPAPLLPGSQKRTAFPGASDGAAGEQMVAVRGKLVDQQKRPVQEASVTLIPLGRKGLYQAFSGVDGTFAIDSVPAGRYRVLVASPGHVALDLESVEVPMPHGLDLQLSLVDYPLNIKGRRDTALPPEKPQPVPQESPAPQGSPAPQESPPPPAGAGA